MRVVFLLLLSLALHAHPHAFVDVYPDVSVENGMVRQIGIKWLMDEMSSSMLIMEFDKNSNGKIDKDENSYIKDNYFMSLKNFGFYTYVKDMEKSVKYRILDFTASIHKNKNIVYKFTIQPLNFVKKENLKILFYDKEFFTSFTVEDEFLSKNTLKNYRVEDYDGDYFFGYILKYGQ